MDKLTIEERIYEDIFNIVSSNYDQQDDSQMGDGEFIMNDAQRENMINELVAYILNKK